MSKRFFAVLVIAVVSPIIMFCQAGNGQGAPAKAGDQQAEELLKDAETALKAGHPFETMKLLDQVEEANPKQPGLWLMRGKAELASNNASLAALYFQKEVSLNPGNGDSAKQGAQLLMKDRRYLEAAEFLEKPILEAPGNYELQVIRTNALLRGGKKAEGIKEAERISKATTLSSMTLNNLAYDLTDTDSALDLAQSLGEKALKQAEQEAAETSLREVERQDLAKTNTLAVEWDTMGWVYYKSNNLPMAEKYLKASWLLGQFGATADHLEELFQKEGVSAENAGEELGRMEAVDIALQPKSDQRAEFYLLISKDGIEDAQFISGAETLRDASGAIKATKYKFPFPNTNGEREVRRGVLECSHEKEPVCRLRFVTSSLALSKFGSSQITDSAQNGAQEKMPALIRRVAPKYSEAAAKAKIQGTVLLSLVVDVFGRPTDIKVVRSLGFGLDEQAMEAVANWRFNPAMKDGLPIKKQVQVEVSFHLADGAKQP